MSAECAHIEFTSGKFSIYGELPTDFKQFYDYIKRLFNNAANMMVLLTAHVIQIHKNKTNRKVSNKDIELTNNTANVVHKILRILETIIVQQDDNIQRSIDRLHKLIAHCNDHYVNTINEYLKYYELELIDDFTLNMYHYIKKYPGFIESFKISKGLYDTAIQRFKELKK